MGEGKGGFESAQVGTAKRPHHHPRLQGGSGPLFRRLAGKHFNPDLGQNPHYTTPRQGVGVLWSHPPHPSSGAPGQLEYSSASVPSFPPLRYWGAGPQETHTPEPMNYSAAGPYGGSTRGTFLMAPPKSMYEQLSGCRCGDQHVTSGMVSVVMCPLNSAMQGGPDVSPTPDFRG